MRWICLAVCAIATVGAGAQNSGTLEGFVRDSHGRPIATATVHLQLKNTGQTRSVQTDTAGLYRFIGLSPGDYMLRAEGGAAGDAGARPVTIAYTETKKVDLTVEYAFYDEPNFKIAGVTDPVSHGGHGSDTVRRSAEELAKATAELGESSKGENALEAARRYQRAAELDPSEPNMFDWGSELLVHRAPGPAADVFGKGHRLYPRSTRLLLGLAAAWYARGDYDQAARFFFEACDLHPDEPEPYLFLGKVQSVEITQLDGYLERLGRFAKLHPHLAASSYYYAVALWKQRKSPGDSETAARVRDLLENAIRLDAGMGPAYLQLGILYSSQGDEARAIAAFQKAIAVSPGMDEPHYRLGQAYERIGEKDKARQELETYQKMSAKLQQDIERERREIQQFVIELRDGTPR